MIWHPSFRPCQSATRRAGAGPATYSPRVPIRDEPCADTRRSPAASRRTLTVAAASICRRGGAQQRHVYSYARRHLSSSSDSKPPSPFALTPTDIAALDRWVGAEKRLEFVDTLRAEQLADLYITLPTRDGTHDGGARDYAPPREGDRLGYGHHLVFFHPRNPEKKLRWDGTDVDFSPPEPFKRRMWAGGRMEWKRPLHVGDRAEAVSTITSVERKGFAPGETGTPMVFVKQKLEYRKQGTSDVCVEEERSHVYLAMAGKRRGAKEGEHLSIRRQNDENLAIGSRN